jgi:hypothetical protein
MNVLSILIQGWIEFAALNAVKPLIAAIKSLRTDVSVATVEAGKAFTQSETAITDAKQAFELAQNLDGRTNLVEQGVASNETKIVDLEASASKLNTAVANIQSVAGTDCKLVHLQLQQSYTDLSAFDYLYKADKHGSECTVKVLFYTNGGTYTVDENKAGATTTYDVTDGDSVVLSVVGGNIVQRQYLNDINGDNIKTVTQKQIDLRTDFDTLDGSVKELALSNTEVRTKLSGLELAVQSLLDAA